MRADEELIAAVARGDQQALAELLRRWEAPLHRFIARQTGERDVDDLHQETWMRVVRAAPRFDPGRRFSTWLFQIAVNLCRDWHRRRPPEPQRITEAVALLKAAKRPVIIAGGGVPYSEAWEELRQFAEALGIPVTETSAGKGALRGADYLALGGCGVNGTPASAQIVQQADLVLCVGTRLSDFTTGSQSNFRNPDVRFIGINVAGHDAFKQGALPITADARAIGLV